MPRCLSYAGFFPRDQRDIRRHKSCLFKLCSLADPLLMRELGAQRGSPCQVCRLLPSPLLWNACKCKGTLTLRCHQQGKRQVCLRKRRVGFSGWIFPLMSHTMQRLFFSTMRFYIGFLVSSFFFKLFSPVPSPPPRTLSRDSCQQSCMAGVHHEWHSIGTLPRS